MFTPQDQERLLRAAEQLDRRRTGIELTLDGNHAFVVLFALNHAASLLSSNGEDDSLEREILLCILQVLGQDAPDLLLVFAEYLPSVLDN
jgi:hypothetical protein